MQSNLIKQLKVGQVIKSYIEMCKIIGVKPTRGKGRQYHIREFERYCKYKKEGNKFIITEVYLEPLPKIDGRVNNGGNNTKYEDLMDRIIINLLVDYERIDASYSSLMNDYFDFFTPEYKKLYSVGYKRYAEINELSEKFMQEYQQKMGGVVKDCLMTSLNRLKRNNIIDFELNTTILDRKFEQDFASDKMLAEIKKYEDKVHEELDITPFKRIQNPRIQSRFKDKVCEYLDITNYWKVYSLELIDKDTETVEEDRDELVRRFNKSITENVKNKKEDYGWGEFKPYAHTKYEEQIDRLTKLIWKLPAGYTSEYQFQQLLAGKDIGISDDVHIEQGVKLVDMMDYMDSEYGIPF